MTTKNTNTSDETDEPPMPYIDTSTGTPEIVVPHGARMSDALVVMVEGPAAFDHDAS